MLKSHVLNCAVVLDSQELFGRALSSVLIGTRIVERARVAGSLDDALRILVDEPQVLILFVDLVTLGSEGKDAVRMLRHRFSGLRIVLVSASATRDEIFSYIASGAHGFILKTQTGNEIVTAVRIVLSGNVFVPPMVCKLDTIGASQVVPDQLGKVVGPSAADDINRVRDGTRDPAMTPGVNLSSRRQSVLRLISKGLSNKAIARELGLAESTVKVHINSMFRVLKVHNRIEAVTRAGWQN